MWTTESFAIAVSRHDATLSALGLEIWAGAEPTFTDRGSQSPEWLGSALGGAKEMRARDMLAELARQTPGSVVLRSTGRRYPGEDTPRWNYGLYLRRDGLSCWDGPPDPLLAQAQTDWHGDLAGWASALINAFSAQGWHCDAERHEVAATGFTGIDVCIAREDANTLSFALSAEATDHGTRARIDLPVIATVPECLQILHCIAQAATAHGLPSLIIGGALPPVDQTVELTTITPDPAVIEVNAAPSARASEFLERSRMLYAAATTQRLSTYRLYFNGTVADSGGGGQITLGGPSPAASPFVVVPQLLPRLVRFLNHHPCLSYLYSHEFVGSSGQSARADERGSDSLDELALTLALLARTPDADAALLWRSLSPFLCDIAGNNHRAEINIEKLWNPYLPGRGQLGLVEFRALRMQQTPERATALVCLLRAITAMLMTQDYEHALIDWGRTLHQRFALPFYLEQDLCAVLDTLDDAGLGLGEEIETVLRREEFRYWASVTLPGATLELRRGLEFWPLLGDVASPEQGGTSRLIDSSTTRVELRLRPDPPHVDGTNKGEKAGAMTGWEGWQASVGGIALPWRDERDAHGPLKVFSIRYRSFTPSTGLHPTLNDQSPVTVQLQHPAHPDAQALTIHEWRPGNLPYDGLPSDIADAAQRRAERLVLNTATRRVTTGGRAAAGLGEYCLDLRHPA